MSTIKHIQYSPQKLCIRNYHNTANVRLQAMSSVSGTVGPTFPRSWLGRNPDRLSFSFSTPRLAPPAPPTVPVPPGYPHSNTAQTTVGDLRHLIDTHNVLCAFRFAGQPCGRASPGNPSDTRCLDRPARLLSVSCKEKRRAR
jgi:hypothetical protein